MLFYSELYNLYTSANPDLDPEIQTTAIKRKFLQGISPEIKRNIFVFCNDPYDTAVSRDKLLEYCRNAKVYLSAQSNTNLSVTIGNGSREENSNGDSSGRNEVISAIERLNTQLQQHVNQTEERLTAQNEVLAALGRSNYRGRGSVRGRYVNSPNRYSRGSHRGRGNIRARTPTDNNTRNVVCFKCGGINHYARNCLSGN